MPRFTIPRDIYHGKDALQHLSKLSGKRAILCVGGTSMKKNGFLQKSIDYLKKANIDV